MKVVKTERGYRRARITDYSAFWLILAVAEGIACVALPLFLF